MSIEYLCISTKMRFQTLCISLLCGFSVVLAQDPLPIFVRQTQPCFGTKQFQECDMSLAENITYQSPNIANMEANTLVYLFTPESPDEAEALHECGGKLPPGSTYDPDANTEIFIHGWLDGVCRTAWMRESKEQVFERARRTKSSYNVILVDWTWGNTPDYYIASQNCKIVGEQVGFVINNIMRQKSIGPEKFHVIGHSFGAIAAGFTGRTVAGLRRITGLDPSLVPFINDPPDQRLTYRDAQIVDIIHSNAGDCFQVNVIPSPCEKENGFCANTASLTNGDFRQLGHADFYPNGGTIQTSCIPYIFISLLKGDILYGLFSIIPSFCFHLQAIQYYKISINPQGCEYVGVASDSYKDFLSQSPGKFGNNWAVMGMDYEIYLKKNGKSQKYYLTTRNTCPYYDDSYLSDKNYPFKTSCTK